MRKRGILGVAVLAAMLAMSGCSGNSDTNEAEKTTAEGDTKDNNGDTKAEDDTKNEDDKKGDDEDESTDSIRDLIGVGETLSAAEFESLCEAGGYDSAGRKEADYDEIMEAGKPCDGWGHFDVSGSTAASKIVSSLKLENIELENYDDRENEMNNYYALDEYGKEYSYFMTYDYYMIVNDKYSDGWSGRVVVASDTVTGELLYVGTYADDIDDLKAATKAALEVVANKVDILRYLDNDFDDALDSGEGEGYYEFGDVWLDIIYDLEPSDEYYQYSTYVYMADE